MSDLKTIICIGCIGLVIFIAGALFDRIVYRSAHPIQVGSLTINYDDPTKELLGFKFEKDLPEIEKSRYISFEVIVEGSPDSDPENSQGENS